MRHTTDKTHNRTETKNTFLANIDPSTLPEAFQRPINIRDDSTRKVFLNGKTLLQLDEIEEASLIKGLIREQSVNFLFGEEGSGKSLMAMNLAISVATGAKQFLGYELLNHGKVLYLNNELPFKEFVNRFKKMAETLNVEQHELLSNMIVPQSVPPFETFWKEINDICRVEKPVLIILDCLYWSHDKEENNSSGMKQIMRLFTTLRDKYNLAVVILHHTKKRSRFQTLNSNNMRGSGVFAAATDTNIELRRSENDETKRIFKPTKLRYATDAMRQTRLLSLVGETLWFQDEGATDEEEHITKVRAKRFSYETIKFDEIIKPGEILTRREITERCQALGYRQRTVDYTLNEAKKSGTVRSPKHGLYTI